MSNFIPKELKDFTDEELKSFMKKGIDLFATNKYFIEETPLKPHCAALLGLHLYLGFERHLTKEEEIKFDKLYQEIK
jgi:hypothetical protein